MMKLMLLLFLLPLLINIKGKEIELDNKTKALVIIVGPYSCHQCLVAFNDRISKLKVKNFKYYVLLISGKSIIIRKSHLENYKKYLNPDDFVFLQDEAKYQSLLTNYKIEKFPEVLLFFDGKQKIVKYDSLFNKLNFVAPIDSLLNNFNEN